MIGFSAVKFRIVPSRVSGSPKAVPTRTIDSVGRIVSFADQMFAA